MTARFNPPPGWPTPPPDWTPPPGWQPDPAWPAAPPHWAMLVDDTDVATVYGAPDATTVIQTGVATQRIGPAAKRTWVRDHKILTALGSALAVLIILAVVGSIAAPPRPDTTAAASTPNTTSTPAPQTPPAPAPTSPALAASVPRAAPGPPPANDGTPAAIFAKDTWWDQHFQPGSVAQCRAEGEAPAAGALRAWDLPDGGLACVDGDAPDSPTRGGRITGADVYVPARTNQQQALTIVAALLPSDVSTTATAQGMNADFAPKPDGTCVEVGYSSPSLGHAISTNNPGWPQPDDATASLYSGHGTGDGSDSVYRATSVHEAIVSIGGLSPSLTC